MCTGTFDSNRFLCKADIRNPLRYLLMKAVASRSVSGSFQLPLTEASPLTRRLVLRALEAEECLSAFRIISAVLPQEEVWKSNIPGSYRLSTG